jgi:ABC-type branched-subunit amino acid transport system substrate-binding protein
MRKVMFVGLLSVVLALMAATAFASPRSESAAPVKVMVIAPVGTPVQDFPDILAGAVAASRSVNKAHGIHGRPIQILFCNDNTDPNKAQACARDAVSENVVAVVAYTLFAAQAYPILTAAGIPIIGNIVTTDADTSTTNAFPLVPGSLLMNAALPVALKAHGKHRVAGVSLDVAASRAQLVVIERGVKAAGLEYVGGITIPNNTADNAPYIQKLKALGADSAILSLNAQGTIQLIRAGAQLGADILWAHQSQVINQSTVLQPLGSLSDGMLVATSISPPTFSDRGIKVFNSEMDAAAKAGVGATNDRRWTTVDAWLAIHAIQLVGNQIKGVVTKASLMARLGKTRGLKVENLITWSPGTPGPSEFPRLSNGRVIFTVAKGGKLQLDKSAKPINVFKALGLN